MFVQINNSTSPRGLFLFSHFAFEEQTPSKVHCSCILQWLVGVKMGLCLTWQTWHTVLLLLYNECKNNAK